MKLILLCDAGCETACAQETGLTPSKTGDGFIIVDVKDKKAAALLTYHAQTVLDVLIHLSDGTKEYERIVKGINWQPIKDVVDAAATFAVRATSPALYEPEDDVKEEVGGFIKETIKKKVDLEKPDLVFVAHVTEPEIALGLSLAGFEMRKREYKVFSSNRSLRSTVAASALRLIGYTSKERLLLPFEDDGTLAIEAALLACRKSPYRYRKEFLMLTYWPEAEELLRTEDGKETTATIPVVVPSVQFLKAIQKNAKIAGVQKMLEVTKAELDFIDTRFDKKSFDLVLAQLPCSGKHRTEKVATGFSDDLAYQARYILAKGGKVGILSLKPDEHIPAFEKHGFKELTCHALYMGEQAITLIIFTSNK